VKDSEAMHAAITGSRFEIIAGAGHCANLERPAAFNHIVLEFLHAV
jgi:pimeloyl-ACP methyl ester carboxylesterase